MSLPFPFLAGLLVLFATREITPSVTGSGRIDVLAPYLLLLALPAVLAMLALRLVQRQLGTGRLGGPPPRAVLRLSAMATPLSIWCVAGPGGWVEISSRAAGSSHLADIALLLLLVYLAEVPRLVWATAAEFAIELAEAKEPHHRIPVAALPRWADLQPLVRSRLSWPLLLLLPCAMFGLGLDLLQLDRRAHMFFLSTGLGSTLGTLTFLGITSAVLPMWFRFAFGVVPSLPEPVGTRLRQIAVRLGFPESRVMLLPTGNRAMNAMLVGPLPVGRFLCLTDGILGTLDADSLEGVVAHEVGHAQKGHPMLLMALAVVVPLLLPAPLAVLHLQELSTTSKALLAILSIVVIWTTVRTLAHRFEHEADAASVRALGAGPCTRALMVVSRLAMPLSHGLLRRHFSLHPEERARCEFMRRYEGEPAFRERFEAGGRRLRRNTLTVLGLATVLAVAAWIVDWPFEGAIWRFRSGDFVGAQRVVTTLGDDVPPRWQEPWKRLREELGVALAIAPGANDWDSARAGIEGTAWSRGLEVLRRSGPEAALPWFALALEVEGGTLLGAIHDYCSAARDGDTTRMQAARAVVQRIGVPAGLEAVFAD